MSNYLQYDIENLEKNEGNIETKRTQIEVKMKEITDAITDLKVDWQTEDSKKVFDMVDLDWLSGVTATLKTLEDMYTAINNAKIEYEKIESYVKNDFKF